MSNDLDERGARRFGALRATASNKSFDESSAGAFEIASCRRLATTTRQEAAVAKGGGGGKRRRRQKAAAAKGGGGEWCNKAKSTVHDRLIAAALVASGRRSIASLYSLVRSLERFVFLLLPRFKSAATSPFHQNRQALASCRLDSGDRNDSGFASARGNLLSLAHTCARARVYTRFGVRERALLTDDFSPHDRFLRWRSLALCERRFASGRSDARLVVERLVASAARVFGRRIGGQTLLER